MEYGLVITISLFFKIFQSLHISWKGSPMFTRELFKKVQAMVEHPPKALLGGKSKTPTKAFLRGNITHYLH
jgi:hypothetical protein